MEDFSGFSYSVTSPRGFILERKGRSICPFQSYLKVKEMHFFSSGSEIFQMPFCLWITQKQLCLEMSKLAFLVPNRE